MPGQSSRRLLAPTRRNGERLGTIGFEIIEVHSHRALGVERNVCLLLKRKADDTNLVRLPWRQG